MAVFDNILCNSIAFKIQFNFTKKTICWWKKRT